VESPPLRRKRATMGHPAVQILLLLGYCRASLGCPDEGVWAYVGSGLRLVGCAYVGWAYAGWASVGVVSMIDRLRGQLCALT